MTWRSTGCPAPERGSPFSLKPSSSLADRPGLWSELQKLNRLVGNEAPLFWARDCAVVNSRLLSGGHLSLTLSQDDVQRRAIAWRWHSEEALPERCDVAFTIGMNRWKGESRLQLELKALRQHSECIDLVRGDRQCPSRLRNGLAVRNDEGQEICAEISPGSNLVSSDPLARHPMVLQLLEEASLGLGLRP